MRNRPVRIVIVALFALVGCVPLGEPGPPPSGSNRGRTQDDVNPENSGSAASGGGSASSPVEPCMIDPSDGRLKRCHHVTSTGACVHYGSWCNGDDLARRRESSSGNASSKPPCLYDPSDGRTKACHHVTTDGKCAHYGAWCGANELGNEPCMYDDKERRYLTCHHVTTDGKCVHFGSAGSPK